MTPSEKPIPRPYEMKARAASAALRPVRVPATRLRKMGRVQESEATA